MRRTVALAGNPNVGKSTVFNALTGSRQHTGNWSGKTVACAEGRLRGGGLTLTDLPGTYSLRAHSEEERAAREFLVSGQACVVVLVADAGCLERSLILALQVLEVQKNAILCLNLMDEAVKKKLSEIIDEINAAYNKNFDVDVASKSALQMRDILLKNGHLRDSARNNSLKDFRFAYFDAVQDALIAGYEQNQDFFALLLDNDEKKRELMQVFLDDIYKKLREE